MAADPVDRSALMGDLAEEFARLWRRSPDNARAWYWRQAAKSAPHLFLKRLRAPETQKLLIGIGAAVVAFFLLRYWDLWVARNAAREFAAATNAQNYFLPRMVYLIAQMAGFVLAGAMIAAVTFARETSFLANAAIRLAPIGAVLLAPTLFAMVSGADNYDLSFRLIWITLAIPSLISGAGAYWMLSNRSH